MPQITPKHQYGIYNSSIPGTVWSCQRRSAIGLDYRKHSLWTLTSAGTVYSQWDEQRSHTTVVWVENGFLKNPL